MGRVDHLSLPLLAKELVELSGRPRTYAIRVVYAGALLLISWLVLFASVGMGATSPLDILGRGRVVVLSVGVIQNISLQLLLPAIACGVFTIEKERNTIGLLFLTRLGPWTILFEKLLSRLVLTFSLILVGYPILAFGYALGGITLDQLFAQFLTLFVNSVAIICIAVMCSAYFRTTTGALLGSYFTLFMLRLGIAVSSMVLFRFRPGTFTEEALLGFLVMGGINPAAGVAFTTSNLLIATLLAIPWMIISVVCVLLARWFLVRRAFLAPKSVLREIFKRLDGIFERANKNVLTRGIVLLRPTVRLPENNPVSWRETTTRSLGQARYLIRLLLLLEVPTLFILAASTLSGRDQVIIVYSTLIQTCVWLAMMLTICVLSASLISGERSRQTLDVLMTTPLQGRDIVLEKLAGIERLIWIFEVPLWTCVVVRCLTDQNILFAICHATMLIIYPRQFAWYGMWFGLRAKNAVIAVVKSLLALLCQCVGPFIIMYGLMITVVMLSGFRGPEDAFLNVMLAIGYFSPLLMFGVSEASATTDNMGGAPLLVYPTVAVFISSAIHGGFLVWARRNCLLDADKNLGRAPVVIMHSAPIAKPPEVLPAIES